MDRERFEFQGRPCFRFTLRDSEGIDQQFSVVETVADRYRVYGLIAIGEDSALLAATDDRTRTSVLLKAIRPAGLPHTPPGFDPVAFRTEEVRRLRHGLQTERRLLVRMQNLGAECVPVPRDYVFDLNPDLAEVEPGTSELEPFLVLQRLPGETLDVFVDRHRPDGVFTVRTIAMLLPIIEAIAALQEPWEHPSGSVWHVLYGDLKPANILVGPNGRVWLLDFGGCQVVIDGQVALYGSSTPGYAAPECFGPPRALLPCADVHTIGATLWHVFTGIDPGRRPNRSGEIRPPDPAELPRWLSPPLRTLIAECLAPRPSDRPPDARAVADRLTAWQMSQTMTPTDLS